MSLDLVQSTRYTQRTTTHDNCASTGLGIGNAFTYVGHLITAVNVCKDMTAGNYHSGIAAYSSSLLMPINSTTAVFVGVIT